jgi:hypothetical protein
MDYQKLILQVLLLKVELLRHLFNNWRHLLQQGLAPVICAVGCKSTGAFGKYDFIYGNT